MALSLGKAALSLAAGAAKGYNEDVAAKRKAELDRMNRVQELVTNSKLRLVETDFSTKLAQQAKDHEFAVHIQSAGGPDTYEAKAYNAQTKLGWSAAKIQNAVLNNIPLPEVAMPKEGSRDPYEYASALMDQIQSGSLGKNKRVQSGIQNVYDSKFSNGNDPRDFNLDPNMLNILNNQGEWSRDQWMQAIGKQQPQQPTQPQQPPEAASVTPAPESQATVTPMGQTQPVTGTPLSDYSAKVEGTVSAETSPDGKNITLTAQPSASSTAVPGATQESPVSVTIPAGSLDKDQQDRMNFLLLNQPKLASDVGKKLNDLQALQMQQKAAGFDKDRQMAIDKLQADIQPVVKPYQDWAIKPQVKVTQVQKGDQLETTLVTVGSKDGKDLHQMSDPITVGVKGVRTGAGGSHSTVTNALKKDIISSSNTVYLADQLANIDSVTQNGLVGWVKDHFAEANDLITSFTGMPYDPKKGFSPTSMAYYMAQGVATPDQQEAVNWYDTAARRGTASTLRMLLATSIARDMKGQGELSINMVKMIDKQLEQGFNAGGKNSNIVKTFRNMALNKAKANVMEIVGSLPAEQTQGLKDVYFDSKNRAWVMIRSVDNKTVVDQINLGG